MTEKGYPCSRDHRGLAMHTVRGYAVDELGGYIEPAKGRTIGTTSCDEADALRETQIKEHPNLAWCVEWHLLRD